MKIQADQEQLLHRGGRPTLADLVEKLTFSPAKGSIELNGARMVLSRVTFGADLQDELVRRFGEHEAMVLMLRLGYRNGREDAEFIRRAWPNLEVGDAFTAGTRLHMMTGTVRVETLHNDFDFRNDRFSGDFLWHGSVEATEYQRRHGRALTPVCWAQTGYAAGYASVFFRKLILYKEVSCAAMGDRSCRVIGKTIDDWGKDDPFVRMFLEEVLVTRAEMPSRTKTTNLTRSHSSEGVLNNLIVAPIRRELDQLAQARLPALITGAPGTGRRIAAEWLHGRRFPGGDIITVLAGSAQVMPAIEALRTALQQKSTKGQSLMIDGIDQLPPDQQYAVQDLLRFAEATAAPVLVVGLSTLPVARMQGLNRSLLHDLTVMPLSMPPLVARRDDLPALAELLLVRRDQTADQVVHLTADAKEVIAAQDWTGNLPQLRSTVRRAALSAREGRIDADILRAALEDAPAAAAEDQPTVDIHALWHLLQPMFDAGVGLDSLVSMIEHHAVDQAGGNVSAAARQLGLSRAKLDYRLRD